MRGQRRLSLSIAIASAALSVTSASKAGDRFDWVGATPDAMAEQAFVRARRGGSDAVAALLVAYSLHERTRFGLVPEGLSAIATSTSPFANDALWLAERLVPQPEAAAWPRMAGAVFDDPVDPRGLVRAFAVLGPFPDSGGGLARLEGPEDKDRKWMDPDADFSWGVYDVRWRRALPSSVRGRGLPLDLYVQPRSESCTYLGSSVTFPTTAGGAARNLVMHVAAAGAVRVLWDGVTIASSDEVHSRAILDRIRVALPPALASGSGHVLGLKVCAGPLADDGRVRVRFTDDALRGVTVESSSALRARAFHADENRRSGERGPKPKALETSLQRMLRVSGRPTPEELLTAAIARTLGGADDQRSPRAPGLLDRVAGAAPPLDILAMVGWISPFGANRSGWLNAAEARARAETNEAVLGFVQRRRVASLLSSQLSDWGHAAALLEPLRLATDPEAVLIRAVAQKQLGAEGLSRASLQNLLASVTREKERTPIATWQEVFDLSRSDPPVALRAARRLSEILPEGRGADYVASFRHLGGQKLEEAAARVFAEQHSVDQLIAIGKELADAGRNEWAQEALLLADYLSPNNALLHRQLSQVAMRLASDVTDKERSKELAIAENAYRRARELEPSNALTRAEGTLRSGASGGKSPAQPDEDYIVPPETFLKRAHDAPALPGQVFDRQLHWVRVVTYHPDRRVSQLMHYAREIEVEPRVEDERYEQLPLESDRTELLFARVHRKDGTRAAPEEEGSTPDGPFVRWPKLGAGDVVEVALRSWTRGPVGRRGDGPFRFIDYVGSIDTRPVLYNEVVVASASALPLSIDILHGKPDRVVKEERHGMQVERYIWDHPPTVREEPFAPKLSESLPVVVGSTYRTWSDFRSWYRAAVSGFTEPDDQVRRLARELTKGKVQTSDKIRALFNFVADDIRYVNYVSGEWWLPNRPQELLARRQGDCDDKAILLISLLKAVGIPATEVLVQTRYTGEPSLLRSGSAAIPAFDHGIAYLPTIQGGMWLDATSPESRMGPLPSMDARASALFVDDPKEGRIIDTPASSPADHGIAAQWTIQLEPSGRGLLSAVERHSGDAAFYLRTNLKQPDTRAQWLERALAMGWYPTVSVEAPIEFNGELEQGRAELKYHARSGAFARREGNELAVSISQTTTLTSQLAPLAKRTLPVVLPPSIAPSHDVRVIRVLPPKGYVLSSLPPAGVVDGGPFGHAELAFQKEKGGGIVVTRSILFDLSTIPLEKYEAFRGWLQSVDRLMQRSVRFIPEQQVPGAVP